MADQHIIGYDPNTGKAVYSADEKTGVIVGYDPNSGKAIYGSYEQPTTPETTAQPRGFWSATKEMVAGIPSAVKSVAEMAAHGVAGDYMWVGQKAAELGSSITPRAMQLEQQGYGMGGYPAAIVRTVGEQMGVPSEAIAEDWRQRNIKALAGDIAARFYNAQGKILSSTLDSRVIGLSLDEIRKIPKVIGVATGADKVLGVVGATRSKLIDHLIIDLACANAILKYLASAEVRTA